MSHVVSQEPHTILLALMKARWNCPKFASLFVQDDLPKIRFFIEFLRDMQIT